MKNPAKLLAGAFAALAAVTSFADEGTREIEIAEIKVQRRDRVEYAWGEQNDVHELTYAVNADGSASLYVGTEDGTKKVIDEDAIRIVKPYRLEPENYVVYPIQPSDASQPVIQIGDNAFSLWNYISGSTTNYSGKPGVTGATRTICVRSLNDDVKICRVDYTVRGQPSPLGPEQDGGTHGQDSMEGEFAVQHDIVFHNGYMNMNDNPPSAWVTNFVVYGFAGDTRDSTIDASVADITVVQQDGRTYKLGTLVNRVEDIHKVQDRWSYYRAAHSVDLEDNPIYFDPDHFTSIKSDGELGGGVYYDGGSFITWDRGNSSAAPFIRGFSVVGDGTVKIYVTTKFGSALTVQATSVVNGTYADVATTNNGIVDYGGRKVYELVASEVNATQGFYKVKATIDSADLRDPEVTIHVPAKFIYGGKTYAPVVNGTKLEFVEQ